MDATERCCWRLMLRGVQDAGMKAGLMQVERLRNVAQTINRLPQNGGKRRCMEGFTSSNGASRPEVRVHALTMSAQLRLCSACRACGRTSGASEAGAGSTAIAISERGSEPHCLLDTADGSSRLASSSCRPGGTAGTAVGEVGGASR